MPIDIRKATAARPRVGRAERSRQVKLLQAILKIGDLPEAIQGSTHFSSITTDAKGVIQSFNVGAERMLGYAASEVRHRVTPAQIVDPQGMLVRARALSLELSTAVRGGFEAMVGKASRGLEDIYELTYIRKDGSRLPALVAASALRGAQDAIIGYLLISADGPAPQGPEPLQAGVPARAGQQAMLVN